MLQAAQRTGKGGQGAGIAVEAGNRAEFKRIKEVSVVQKEKTRLNKAPKRQHPQSIPIQEKHSIRALTIIVRVSSLKSPPRSNIIPRTQIHRCTRITSLL